MYKVCTQPDCHGFVPELLAKYSQIVAFVTFFVAFFVALAQKSAKSSKATKKATTRVESKNAVRAQKWHQIGGWR